MDGRLATTAAWTGVEIEVLSRHVNLTVLRLPWRRFPGVVLQGDTLWTLVADARELAAATAPEAQELARDLAERLSEMLGHYAAVLDEHGIPLPYSPP